MMYMFIRLLLLTSANALAHDFAKQLYEKLLHQGYNNLMRPVTSEDEKVTVRIGLKLSQLIDVDEKNQIMTTNVWVLLEWNDTALSWNKDHYEGVSMLYVPVRSIWHPDIVLYNNADGNYQMTMETKATLLHTGTVRWRPPASFKSACGINVLFFPFDQQECEMIFGSWTYNKNEVDLVHMLDSNVTYFNKGIEMEGSYQSVEWDIMDVPAQRTHRYYAGSSELFVEWKFSLKLKRKFLFYTVNLLIPLCAHAFLTVLVFYLPSDSREKISLCINILLSLIVFFLMLAEIIPSTSLVVPLLGKYLLFTMILVTVSVITNGIILNIHFRSASTHEMPDSVRKIFLYFLPRLLRMRRPKVENSQDVELKHIRIRVCSCWQSSGESRQLDGGMRYGANSKRAKAQMELIKLSEELQEGDAYESSHSPVVQKAIEGAIFIANHLKHEDDHNRTKEDWKYVALVIDRFFLLAYGTLCLLGTLIIILSAPMLFDNSISYVQQT